MYEGEKNSSAGRNRLENLYSSYGILFWAEVARRESEKFQINLRLLHVHVSNASHSREAIYIKWNRELGRQGIKPSRNRLKFSSFISRKSLILFILDREDRGGEKKNLFLHR